MSAIETAICKYFQRMAQIRSTGGATSETSYYSALENLVNELGKHLGTQVVCNGQLKDQGVGHPDFGLYSNKQCRRGIPKPGQGEIPERGVVEVKALGDDTWQTATGKQAAKYFRRYRLVLVTNYREFRLIGENENGDAVEREFYILSTSEHTFWSMAANPRKSARAHAAQFGEFLRRVMTYAAPLIRAEDVAWFLASYARDALNTLAEKNSASLVPLRTSLQTALGVDFTGKKGEHFFRSTLVQTLFYGVFSSWVVWARGATTGRFDWKLASYTITVPMIRSLFEEIAKPSRLGPLGLMNILDNTGEALNRVDRTAFFKTFDSGKAVQHFYEPFLASFDPELRKAMGVWYTPPEIVRYMVERVDQVLRNELSIPDGLANKNVFVLDPCCGTGAYVVEVLRKIEETLRERGEDALIGQDVQEAARERVFGFEILSAPFVIAHWQVGDLLAKLGAPVDATKGERPAIYLTNALTGWKPPSGPKASLPLFPELEQERDQAELVKREVPILVVLGNPPYNAFAGTSPDEEDGLVEPYKKGLQSDWNVKKFNLDELYVRFLRIAERRIAATGRGLICFISSYSYLGDVSFVVARKLLLEHFDRIWIDSLNGDSRETGKRTPTGEPDPSVFSTRYNRAGIQLGTAVGLFLKRSKSKQEATVTYRDFWGKRKREEILASLHVTPFDEQYQVANPQSWNKLSFRPRDVGSRYLAWPKLPELAMIEPVNGLMEKRGGALYDVDRTVLSSRMKTYFNANVDWGAFKLTGNPLATDAARYEAKKTRTKVLATDSYDPSKVVRYIVRPFDVRHAYYTGARPIWNEPRPLLWEQFSGGNQFLMSRPSGVADPEGAPLFFTRCLGDNDAQRGHSYYLPFAKHEPAVGMLEGSTRANLSAATRAWLRHLGMSDPDQDAMIAAGPWHHALAISYSPAYLGENADGIAIDWPRIPLPDTRAMLDNSIALGAKVAALLDTEVGVPGVTSGRVAEHLRVLGNINNVNLTVNASWGRRDRRGRVYPGRGKTISRSWTEAEKKALRNGFEAQGVGAVRGFALLGSAIDVHLNETTAWRGVPEAAWSFVIGGYLVIKKWLSYREEVILGRPLNKEEAREVTSMVRRLTAVILLSDQLDENYVACRDNAYNWSTPPK